VARRRANAAKPDGTPIAVQQKLMRHGDIRTTMNIYGDIVTDEMAVASGRVTRLALNGR
jgi:hypothetical protein